MVKIKAFTGIRPVKEKVKQIASLPYDVITKQEARKEAQNNPLSFLHVIKPEIDLPDDTGDYNEKVYQQGVSYIHKMITDGTLIQDNTECLYVYAQTMNGRTQYGILAGAHINDYYNNKIKKHELTRPDKEEDRKQHIRFSNMNYEPVFFTYPANNEIDEIVAGIINTEPEYNFVADDGFGHHLWVINDTNTITEIIRVFEKIPATYIADGHHRTASAAGVGKELADNNPNHTGNEEYNYFMAVHFPDNQLKIIDYNRVVTDLNGLTENEFLDKLQQGFSIDIKGTNVYKPDKLHNFSMYLNGKWYSLDAKTETYDDNDPIKCLDVTILSEQVLAPLLNITDLRKSKRIDFVGGIRGLGELKKRVDNGEMAAAFALYPVSLKQLFNIADSGNIMPPKTTWFEPKLRSGLVIHSLK
jgi:uncharacterized protein (DUF1015 family)